MAISLQIFAFLVLGIAVSHAFSPSQVYWNSVLPNTPMPSSIRDLLPTAGVHPDASLFHSYMGTALPSGSTDIRIYAAGADQIPDDPTVTLFFIENYLHTGVNMNLQFTRTTYGASFLPRGKATSIPFSSSKLPEILTRFSVEPNSLEAASMKNTLELCEFPAIKGETKYCATSLESMVDFTTTSLGTSNVRAVSTKVEKEDTVKQPYTIASSGVEKLVGEKLVVCHPLAYVYAVFYCHVLSSTKAYVMPLVGKDGTKVEAVAICHSDTSAWNPNHVAFKVLKVKPGTVPICHFLPPNHIVWTPTSSS